MKETASTSGQLDAIELEVFKHLFASVAEEMGTVLMRSAYSANIKERRDFSCALFDRHGAMVAQAAHIPVHLGSAPMSVQAVIGGFPPPQMEPGDVFVVNDPFAGGTHLPDITLVAPLFVAGDAVPRFFLANRAHHADVGGITPGSLPLSTHIDEEGIRIAPVRLDEPMIERIAKASRTPDQRRGDLMAQRAALTRGQRRLAELCEKYGKERLETAAEALQHYAGAFVRQMIEDLPDGMYDFEDYLDDDGLDRVDIALRCRLTIEGDHALVDLTGSDDQGPGPMNAVRAITLSAVMYCFRCLAPAAMPSNDGILRPVTLRTRRGSIVDAQAPAAVAAGNVETSQRIVDVVFGALAQVLPDTAPAASSGTMNNLTVGPRSSARTTAAVCAPESSSAEATPTAFAYYETIAGGGGASAGAAGGNALQTHMTNTRNTPVEALEHAYPFQVIRYAVRRGSGGGGRQHGGDGVVRAYRFQTPCEVTLITERRRRPPYGLNGGEPGAVGVNRLTRASGEETRLPGKCTIRVEPGDCLEIATPGGGGWGDARFE